jgi:Spy/CpxP family protein refolding chaperone
MKKMLVLFAFTAIVSAGAMAQDQTTQDQTKSQQDPQKVARDKAEWDRMVVTELKLTPDQQTQYTAISKEYEGKFATLKTDASLNDDARRDKKMALKKEKMDKINAILTPDQQVKYKDLVDKKMKKETAKNDSKNQ